MSSKGLFCSCNILLLNYYDDDGFLSTLTLHDDVLDSNKFLLYSKIAIHFVSDYELHFSFRIYKQLFCFISGQIFCCFIFGSLAIGGLPY